MTLCHTANASTPLEQGLATLLTRKIGIHRLSVDDSMQELRLFESERLTENDAAGLIIHCTLQLAACPVRGTDESSIHYVLSLLV
jgi:hypothetical protein